MSKKAIVGGLIMVLFVLMGVYGDVTVNGEVVHNKVESIVLSVVFLPIMIILFGYIINFVRESLIAFFKETKEKLFKR